LCDFIVELGGRVLRPLHRAPWIDEPPDGLPSDISPGLAAYPAIFSALRLASTMSIRPRPRLACECAVGDRVGEAIDGGWQVRLRLTRTVQAPPSTRSSPSAIITHFISTTCFCRWQRRGFGRASPDGAHGRWRRALFLAEEIRRHAATSLEPDPVRGTYLFAYPAQTDDLTRLPDYNGGTMDLTIYRAEDRREDFVSLVEAGHSSEAGRRSPETRNAIFFWC
jgi:hypothetical protein